MSESNANTDLHHLLFLQREEHYSHLPYEKELQFYEAVKNGDISLLEEIMVPLNNSHLGLLSNNPLRNMQYHLIITIAFITRFCIEGGMDAETAYTLSDVNIRRLDCCTRTEDVTLLHHDIVFDYAKRMQLIQSDTGYSLPVTQCMDYIFEHLHDAVTLEKLAEYTGKNPTYLCVLFKQELKITIGGFIRKKRIEAAENLLKYSDYPPVDISNYLCFNSHSHFISVFKKYTGMTPKEYRKRYYRSKWKS